MHWLSICDPRILTKQCCSKVKVEHNSKREKWKLYKHKWQCKNNGTMMLKAKLRVALVILSGWKQPFNTNIDFSLYAQSKPSKFCPYCGNFCPKLVLRIGVLILERSARLGSSNEDSWPGRVIDESSSKQFDCPTLPVITVSKVHVPYQQGYKYFPPLRLVD